MTVIPPLPLQEAKREVERAAAAAISRTQRNTFWIPSNPPDFEIPVLR